MKITVLDGDRMTDIRTAHEYVAAALDFPDYYGHNLDALADCLGDLPKDTCIVLENFRQMKRHLGGYAERMARIFDETAEACGYNFAVVKE